MGGLRNINILAIVSNFVSFSTPSALHTSIPLARLKEVTIKALKNLGHSSDDAHTVAEVVLYAELRSNNQGIIKITSGGLESSKLISDIRITVETPVSAKIDGGQKIGMVVVAKGVEVAIKKAKTSGISIVGCSNYSSATGALGFWCRKITESGLIGIVMSQCNEMVAPYGSFEPIFGTNPLSIGIPTVPRPQILDMATSAIAYYGLKIAQQEGKSIPSDVAYNRDGLSTVDPSEALLGAIRVFDRSFKGSHLALMVELLAGSLTGAAMQDKGVSKNWGSLIICIDPSILGPKEDFLDKCQEMCDRVKNAKLLDGEEEIFLPGERGDRIEQRRIAEGCIDISSDVYRLLMHIAGEDKGGEVY